MTASLGVRQATRQVHLHHVHHFDDVQHVDDVVPPSPPLPVSARPLPLPTCTAQTVRGAAGRLQSSLHTHHQPVLPPGPEGAHRGQPAEDHRRGHGEGSADLPHLAGHGYVVVDQTVVRVDGLLEGWEDDYLKWEPQQYGGLDRLELPPSKVWTPDIFLFNDVTGQFAEDLVRDSPFLVVTSQGHVRWIPPLVVR